MEMNDVLIVGSGVAALQLATLLSCDKKVRILTKSKIRNANSYLAQGGIAAAIGLGDDPSKHYADTLEAGRFHNNDASVREVLNEAPSLIRDFFNLFDKDTNGNLHLGLEGAHSENRIVHSGGDATGKHVIEYLISNLTENIKVEENVFAYKLIVDQKQKRCIGVKTKDEDGTIRNYYANYVVLATGGCGQIYSFTSNAPTITGDGIAMAYMAGADIADMEFVQFHPTLLYKDGMTKGLISEAVRGEGAILVTEDGTPIMEGVHPLTDLAPRHVVSQTILNFIEKGHLVYLDIRNIKHFEDRFPSITAMCQNHGIDLSEGKIPIVPGSHFLMGGIKTDLIGRSSLEGLFAIGEASCTGLHGANRLASNSLLEGLYQGKKLSQFINSDSKKYTISEFPRTIETHVKKTFLPDLQILKDTMMKRVGIVRSKELLEEQKHWIKELNVNDLTSLDSYSIQDIQAIFMYINASLITEAALTRTESRGGHYRSDFPYENANWCKKIIIQNRKREVGISHE
ncbi:L-aspartate oxidase [Lederbergia wuyishanensis]|uniref:L-aspartate oxidase n=1 Tax=Lederbergia wuyishanensis TaxID=1347903 RepID=A0ABU0D317_9BACI|nr:L-aspartate oxidase [Lederbergia wuyishanensis]MCJ8007093.1 L-aspartate oxidase [Lederbergia wuyishanensis]MDQ0342763.1 L-aspartate oxidase [Lederbergia wuyishanensis]